MLASEPQTRVFVSYSRQDSRFVAWLAEQLQGHGFLVDFDLSTYDRLGIDTGISAEDAWWSRLQELITAADVVVFVVSPDSARSRVCDEEIAFTQAVGKRLIPIICRPVDYAKAPPRLAALNMKISFAEVGAERDAVSLRLLMDALHHDARWYRTATQVTVAAMRWEAAGRPSSDLLRGSALQEAEGWAARRPAGAGPLPDAVLDFLLLGRGQEEELRLIAEVQRVRLDELREVVEPYLLEEIRLRKQHDSCVGSFVRGEWTALTAYLESLVKVESKKWHPERAVHGRSAGATEGYADFFRFPCCGKLAIEYGALYPPQFSSEGCRELPESIRVGPRRELSDWRHGSLLLRTLRPLEELRKLLEDCAVLSISDDVTAMSIERWKQGSDATFEKAVRLAPDGAPTVARLLRWLLNDHRSTAHSACRVIANRALERGIPLEFTAGWLVSNITWGGGDTSPLRGLPQGGLDGFVVGATSGRAERPL